MPAPPPPPPEALGDLKLYRVPEPTTIAARQSKQVRLLAQAGVAFTRLASIDLPAGGATEGQPAQALLRTKNSLANHLGLPLPAGRVAVFGDHSLLLGQADLHDTAVDEDVELKLGAAPDVQVRQTRVSFTARSPEILALAPPFALAVERGALVEEVAITNARSAPTPFELRLSVYGSQHVTTADQAMGTKDGRPIFRLTLPAHGEVRLRYAVEQ
jgi:hypothetical protein